MRNMTYLTPSPGGHEPERAQSAKRKKPEIKNKYLMLGNPTAIQGLKDILEECWHRQGFVCPPALTQYITQILADKLDKNPWQPEPSYAERYMQLKTPREALELGNTCFFTRSVFPTLGQRRGIASSYYVSIGQGCYDHVLRYSQLEPVKILKDHFEYCAEMTWTAVHAHGELREFWDL